MTLCTILQMDELEHRLKELEGTCSPIISKCACVQTLMFAECLLRRARVGCSSHVTFKWSWWLCWLQI